MNQTPPSESARKGFTLIEITLVVAVLLGLISVLYLGVNEFKKGSNRALCIQNVANIQQATRSYCNMNNLDPGDFTTELEDKVINNPGFFPKTPFCPAGGEYTYVSEKVPDVGTPFAKCSIEEHVPRKTDSW
ncbi:MAG: hypothetical protein CMO55_07320 [Verrucomicrobiales bacterium]|nr:hypothetical protein [Verrucomicrobiales bacterium]